jgi:hypothetical protein
MQIQDFNRPASAQAGDTPVEPSQDATAERQLGGGDARGQAEISLLKKRIEHLELVVETARSLMTSNQERLLRRLHDLPQELMMLTAALHRLDGDLPSDLASFDSHAAVSAPARRVA